MRSLRSWGSISPQLLASPSSRRPTSKPAPPMVALADAAADADPPALSTSGARIKAAPAQKPEAKPTAASSPGSKFKLKRAPPVPSLTHSSV